MLRNNARIGVICIVYVDLHLSWKGKRYNFFPRGVLRGQSYPGNNL